MNKEDKRLSFVKCRECDPEYIIDRKININKTLEDTKASYIYIDKFIPRRKMILNKHGDLLIDTSYHFIGIENKITLHARRNNVIRVNICKDSYTELGVHYISLINMVDILNSEKNSKKYNIDIIADPIDCKDEIVNAEIFAINIIEKE